MPGYIARKLCPHIIFVKPDFTKYTAASKKIMDVLKRYGEHRPVLALGLLVFARRHRRISPFTREWGQNDA